MKVEQLKQKNAELRLKKAKIDNKIRLYRILNWIHTDKKIKSLRNKLYV
jgi:hypothetical protein